MTDYDPFEGMVLDCVECETATDPERRSDDPKRAVRCGECGRKHSTRSLEVTP